MSNAMLTVREAAERLNVSEKTVRNLLSHGLMSFHRIGTGRGVIRISENAIVAHLADNEVRADSTAPTSRKRRQNVSLRHIKL